MEQKKSTTPRSGDPGSQSVQQGILYSYNEILTEAVEEYLENLDRTAIPKPNEIERQLLALTKLKLDDQNMSRQKKDALPIPKQLTFAQVARILIELHRVVRIAPSGKNTDRDYDLLAIYMDSGDDEGIYVTSEDQIRSIARQYDRQLTINGAREVMTVLREDAPRVIRSADPDLIAVNNGIFDYRTKRLEPFDPRHVFLSKSRVDYDPQAANPVITSTRPGVPDWDVESWMQELSDDPEVVELLWEILGAIIRPHVSWNKSAWFYSEQGNNGKGTLCELMRNLTGPNSYASIPIADFGKDFLLEPLTRASAIIVDENDVGTFIDRAANLKAVITNDVISINRKYKMPIAYQFYGFMVQCLNEFPRIKDKSESFYRRQLFVPFEKSFTGVERKEIKDDYLQRPEVLRYVLKRVLHMDYHELSEPAATQRVLNEYKEFNDPVRSFWEEFCEQFVWDLLPFPFLYDLYKSWFARTNPSGSPVGRNMFISDLLAIVRKSPTWYCSDKTAKIRPAARMSKPEPLIALYDLKDWMNNAYAGKDHDKLCTPFPLALNYRGIQRYTATTHISSAGGSDTDDQP